MEKGIFICSLLSRIFTILWNDSPFTRKFSNKYPHSKDRFSDIYQNLAAALLSKNIFLHPSLVRSEFGLIKKTVAEMSFINLSFPHAIPAALYESICGIRREAPQKEAPTIYWGYTGRYYDCKTEKGYITDSLQVPEYNHIYFDFSNHKLWGEDHLQAQMIHELLHDVGFEEEDMAHLAYNTYLRTYAMFKPLVSALYKEIDTVCKDFAAKAAAITASHGKEISQLQDLALQLQREGLALPADKAMSTNVYQGTMRYPCDILLF